MQYKLNHFDKNTLVTCVDGGYGVLGNLTKSNSQISQLENITMATDFIFVNITSPHTV